MTPLPKNDREYMRIHGKYFDKDFKTLHNLHDKVNNNGYVYCEIQLGMYSLKQAAILSYNLIKTITTRRILSNKRIKRVMETQNKTRHFCVDR